MEQGNEVTTYKGKYGAWNTVKRTARPKGSFFILYLAVKLGGGWSVINSAYPVYFTKTSDIEIGLKR